MTTTTRTPDAGARWLRCDLHVHTAFDGEKKFGEDIRAAIEALKKAKPPKLAEIADRFVQACRDAADGQGLDLVALTDHNSIDGFRYLKPQFDTLVRQAADQGLRMPAILPGVEFSVGGERPIHFLVIFAAETDPDAIDRAIAHVFGTSDRFDPKRGTPRATGQSVDDFLTRLYDYCRPPSGDRELEFVVLPAHVDGRQGISREVIGGAAMVPEGVTVATSLWDEMKGHLRQRVITRRDWHGFQSSRPFSELPPAFKELLLRWAAARRGEEWDNLSETQKARYRERRHWPLVECSDPDCYEAIGSRYTWLKMEVPDVEGIRLALLDPESRLRRMADGPPGRAYPRIQRVRVKNTDFFDDVEILLNPSLNCLIGGRGTGKSTIIEYLRYGLDRARRDDFTPQEADNVREAVLSILAPKSERDFGDRTGTLLPDHEVVLDIMVAERPYRVTRSSRGLEIVQDPDQAGAMPVNLDIRSLISPRILSQRQIAGIARAPAAQRRELDFLVDADRLQDLEARRRSILETLAQLQATRTRLTEQSTRLPLVETELQKVRDHIAFLEGDGRREVLRRFDEFGRERGWLEEVQRETERLATELLDLAGAIETSELAEPPDNTPAAEWLGGVHRRVREARSALTASMRDHAGAFRELGETIAQEQASQWQPTFEEARKAYDELRREMLARGVDFGQHEKLLQRRAVLERELASLRGLSTELEQIDQRLRAARLDLVQIHEMRLEARRAAAGALEEMDADVRLDVFGFRDHADFESRRDEWFGGAGLQERDWSAMCDYVFAPNGQVPERIWALAEALRADVAATAAAGAVLQPKASVVAALVDSARLTGHFFRALERGDRIRIEDIERFLPEDLVRTKVRSPDGGFKTIETGSVGEKSTAILSLLLAAGEQPIIIDQPEDDLDNQYVYNVVVDLLRRRKFSRQVIIATHNANIPVNGDSEQIVALGVENQLGTLLGAGSIDRPDIKDLVSLIMEGSAEAFRLRRERYGY